MRLRPLRLLRDLSGRSNVDMTELLLQQIAAAVDGARLARAAAHSEIATDVAREDMATVEHTGDEARERLITTLAVSLVTPFDREDIFRVSRSIDDVLDNLRDFVRQLDLFQEPDPLFAPVIDAIVESLELLRFTIAIVTDASEEISARVLAAKKSCNEIRRTYDRQLTHLLQGEVTAEMLRRRELLRRLDVVGLRLGEAVDALADAAVKRVI